MTRRITDNEKKELLQLTPDHITYTLLMDLFGKNLVDGKIKPAKFLPQDVFKLNKGELILLLVVLYLISS